ncbi:MAG TPA: serine hydrolase domain-containing protein [Candidatus Binatia bacterium]|jgi:CubicO group peptidase (beta-lactamase class C family)|nr:serine hydrolase domain-containing protein [Candidatus Binatia bacterium]
MDAPIDGTCDSRFAAVREAFACNFVLHDEIGAAVTVSVGGRMVVDLWGGHADVARRQPWRSDTLVNVFSLGKALTTLAALTLVDQGRLDLDAPVARYWPVFAAGGKEAVTTRQLLCHRAGLPAIRAPLPAGAMLQWPTMTDALARETPWWTPGTRHGYHVNTFGFLVGEVVRRIAGRSLGTVLRDDIARPLDADVHIGLAATDLARVAEWKWLEEVSNVPDSPALTDEHRMLRNTYFNPPGLSGHGVINTAPWRRAEIPSTNGHGNARGVARVFAALAAGGAIDGIRIVSSSALAEACTEHSSGPDAILGRATRFGLGFQLPEVERPIGPNAGAFGHFGAGGSLGFADPAAGVAFGYVMNRMGPRWQSPTTRRLMDAVYACV